MYVFAKSVDTSQRAEQPLVSAQDEHLLKKSECSRWYSALEDETDKALAAMREAQRCEFVLPPAPLPGP